MIPQPHHRPQAENGLARSVIALPCEPVGADHRAARTGNGALGERALPVGRDKREPSRRWLYNGRGRACRGPITARLESAPYQPNPGAAGIRALPVGREAFIASCYRK